MDSSENLDDPQVMKDWIKRVQKWIEEHSPSRKMSEDSVRLDRLRDDFDVIRYANNVVCLRTLFLGAFL